MFNKIVVENLIIIIINIFYCIVSDISVDKWCSCIWLSFFVCIF